MDGAELLTRFLSGRRNVAFYCTDNADLEERRFRSERAQFQTFAENSAEDLRQRNPYVVARSL